MPNALAATTGPVDDFDYFTKSLDFSCSTPSRDLNVPVWFNGSHHVAEYYMSKAHALSQERRNLALDRLGDGAISPPCSPKGSDSECDLSISPPSSPKGECRDTHKTNGLRAFATGQPCCITPPESPRSPHASYQKDYDTYCAMSTASTASCGQSQTVMDVIRTQSMERRERARAKLSGEAIAKDIFGNAANGISRMSRQTTGHSLASSAGSAECKLTRSQSRVSFTSWMSGEKSDHQVIMAVSKSKSIKRGGTVVFSAADMHAHEGERHIRFLTEEVEVYPSYLNDVNSGRPNRIRTSRFTVLTWLPKSLFWQFQRIANIYFLCIVVLVLFPWSPKDWKSKVFPFGLVLLWTALKDLHEDSRRRRDDKLENFQQTLRFDVARKFFAETDWQDVQVGDVLIIGCDQFFPADLILLYSESSEAFISTISLDGETNLKERSPPFACEIFEVQGDKTEGEGLRRACHESLRIMHQIHMSECVIQLGKPQVAVSDVKGFMITSGQDACPISFSNFLPRGCVLRNTPFVLAVAVFVGDETKTRLNTSKFTGKVSNMQKYLNICVWGLLSSLAILCLYAATMSALQEDAFEFCCGDESWLIRLGTFTITFYHVVPMSLYVVFEMLKLILGYQVNADTQMEDPASGELAVARTADLIEEMGQVNFLFSDKTGTLTKNEMVFARACIDGHDVGDFRETNGEAEGVQRVKIALCNMEIANDPFWKKVNWFFMCLATCHSVQVRKRDEEEPIGKQISGSCESQEAPPDLPSTPPETPRSRTVMESDYLGMSPDEVALVEAAQKVGMVLTDRRHIKIGGSCADEVTIVRPDGESKTVAILYELAFTSDRKRMSVVMRLGNDLHLVTKGADSVMEPLMTEPFSKGYANNLREYSQHGLRTLVIGHRLLDQYEFRTWEAEYRHAQNITDVTKDFKVAAVQAHLEKGLTALGITAVEDCLQDGVPDAIATIKAAGVKVWVLTGDKTETAVDIAHSCQLFTDLTTLAYATGACNEEEAFSLLQKAQAKLQNVENAGLVLDGTTVQYCLPSEKCKMLIFELGMASRSCVCCRLTPLQKRNLVDIVRHRDKQVITLAIGDGANDVPMIEGAHLGIAVRGKEGAQAVQVSDVAISQFRFLVPLLLCHGRRAYRRVALFLCFYLYKNVALLMGDVVWMHMDSFRGRIAFPEYLSINYNVFFTSWHILFVLGWDDDVPDSIANSHPQLFLVGPQRALFNKLVFTRWMIFAVYHGCVAWAAAAIFVIKDAKYEKKKPGDFWEGSITAFSVITGVVCLKLLTNSCSPMKWKTSILPTLGALLSFLVILIALSYVPLCVSLQPSMEGIMADLVQNALALITIVTLPFILMLVDVTYETIVCQIWPTPLDKVRAELRGGSSVIKSQTAELYFPPGTGA